MALTEVDLSIITPEPLREFAEVGVIDHAGIHVARTLCMRFQVDDPHVHLAIAACVKALEMGATCLDVENPPVPDSETADRTTPLPWPEPHAWLETLRSCPLVASGDDPDDCMPIRVAGTKVYLQRYWMLEQTVMHAMNRRAARYPIPVAEIPAIWDAGVQPHDKQLEAIRAALTHPTSVICGGPGTGKTWTIAAYLKALDAISTAPVRVALASFTGKAATRMQQSLDQQLGAAHAFRHVRVAPAVTLHRLLASQPYRGFGYGTDRPLPADIVIIDEMSMVSLPLMAAVLEASDYSHLVMLGDPHQLASVEAGNVLADILEAYRRLPELSESSVAGQSMAADASTPTAPTTDQATTPPTPTATSRGASTHATAPATTTLVPCHGFAVTELTASRRYDESLGALAEAIKAADPEAAIEALRADGLEWIDVPASPGLLTTLPSLAEDLLTQASRLHELASAPTVDVAGLDEALDTHQVLCAHRHGPAGVSTWSRAIESWLASHIAGYGQRQWYAGKPILIARADHNLGVVNGDTGVVVERHGTPMIMMHNMQGRLLPPQRLEEVASMHALTIHKSQGSEYGGVTVILPPASSPLLTQQLLYTAVTRARKRVRIIGTREALTAAICTPLQRATGLADRLFRLSLPAGESLEEWVTSAQPAPVLR